MRRIVGLSLLLLVSVAHAAEPMIPTDIASTRDPHSYAEPDRVKVTHVDLDLKVDFAKRELAGEAVLTLDRRDPALAALALDSRALKIEQVWTSSQADGPWRKAKFSVALTDPVLGEKLSVALRDRDQMVKIRYRTAPHAAGLQWLAPRQTRGKRQPFLFTQSQAIQARSWIPLQDTPAVRFTYSARVRTPKTLLALMSANNEPNTPRDGDYRFEMPQPIPSYLMALGVGDLKFKPISGRVGVYAEPELLDAAWNEFKETEAMTVKAEALYGPYRWGRYDLLILPPSFPFGGMENPRLSFITPTVIAGDRSLVSLIAHELAHSWSGNLVTNATWRDLWLNEGFTVFFEGRIMEAVYGADRARMEAALEVDGLKRDLRDLPSADQRLAADFRGRDPDDVFSQVPYVKGQWFLVFLEARFGREKFDAFLRAYFDHFAFQSITTAQFLDYLQKNLLDPNPGIVSRAEVDEWVFQPGIPKTAPEQKSDRFAAVEKARDQFIAGSAPKTLKTAAWTAHEWLHFLNALPEKLDAKQLAALDAAFKFTGSRNSEIAHAWYRVAIRNDYREVDSSLKAYLIEIGRRKLVVPLYEDLLARPDRREFALAVFAEAKPSYHPLTVSTVEAAIAKPPAG
jgi:leukotriene-A4 hydrolase